MKAGSRAGVGKIIDAEFGGKNADDRYCAACRERYPRRSTLCPRCGGALVLWATHAAHKEKVRRRSRSLQAVAALLAFVALLVLSFVVR
jgi:hypothetical protein